MRILVVEDEPAICEVCLRVLTSEGFEVDITVDGNAAQDMLQKKDYDLCLIDIRTPVMNGKQLYQVIIAKYPKLAKGTIFTTGDMMDGYTQRFFELAHRPYLSKPFTPDELRTIVRETLREIENDKHTGKNTNC
jgi:DNA-binding response OmpR family regulator